MLPTIALVGRPNVGKSTLVNSLIGEERVIAFDQPGTTRDSIYLDFVYKGKDYTLIDTAGVRKRGKTTDVIEKFSVIKTLQAIEDANVVVFMIDATQSVSDHDVQLASFIQDAGRALVVCLNKWDAANSEQRKTLNEDCERKLYFVDYAETLCVASIMNTTTLASSIACKVLITENFSITSVVLPRLRTPAVSISV